MVLVFAALLGMLGTGCGTTREYNATQQLVMSDAVDRSIAAIDFRALSGRKVYLDTSYLRQVKGEGFVNAEYVTSALRQQIVGAGCLIQDSNGDAEIIIEARIGTLGADGHKVTFGIPENRALASAASLIPGAPNVPAIPEIAFARREAREAAAKVAAFAYDRETRQPLWQSGVAPSMATARDTWVLGVGPFQGGTIRERTRLASSVIGFGGEADADSGSRIFERPPVDYTAEMRFQDGWPVSDRHHLGIEMLGDEETAVADAQEETPSAQVAASEPIDEESSSAGETEKDTLKR